MAIYRVQRVFSEDGNSNTALAVGAGSLAAAAGARAYGVNQMNKGLEAVTKDLNSQGVNASFNKTGFFRNNGKLTINGVAMEGNNASKLSAGTAEKFTQSLAKNKGTFLKAGGAGLAAAGLGVAGVGALGYGAYKKYKSSK